MAHFTQLNSASFQTFFLEFEATTLLKTRNCQRNHRTNFIQMQIHVKDLCGTLAKFQAKSKPKEVTIFHYFKMLHVAQNAHFVGYSKIAIVKWYYILLLYCCITL